MNHHAGQRIMELRKLNGLTQLDLGRLLYEGLTKNAQQLRVSRLEKTAIVKRKTLAKVAQILGVELDTLMAPIPHHRGEAPLIIDDEDEIHLSAELRRQVPEMVSRIRSLNALPDMVTDVHKSLAGILRQWADELEPEDAPQSCPRAPKRNGSDGGPVE